jgi:hypothetical protein
VFRKDLEDKLSKIFRFKKTTFLSPSDAFEQDTLFVQINNSRGRVSKDKITAKVEGTLIVFSKGNALPFGYFNKAIGMASKDLTKDFFFSAVDTDVASSPSRMQDIHERRTNFLFLYSGQYDPNKGELTNVEFSEVEE